jgi:hypothetical protein
MAKSKQPSRRKKRRVLYPSQDWIDAQRRAMPVLSLYHIKELIADARHNSETAPRGMEPYAVINVVRNLSAEAEAKELLRWLRCDLDRPDWRVAFFRLAMLFCDLGRIDYTPSRSKSGARTWTFEANKALRMGVFRLRAEGLSERAAIRKLGEDPSYDGVFPHREQTPGRREVKRRNPSDEWHEGTRADRFRDRRRPRVNALMKHYKELKKEDARLSEETNLLGLPKDIFGLLEFGPTLLE